MDRKSICATREAKSCSSHAVCDHHSIYAADNSVIFLQYFAVFATLQFLISACCDFGISVQNFSPPPNFCLLACLNFKLVFLYFVPLDICVSRFLSPRTLPTEGYRKSKLRSIFHIHLYFTGVKLGIKICCCSHGSSDRGVSYQVSGLLRVLISRLCDY